MDRDRIKVKGLMLEEKNITANSKVRVYK